MDDQQKFNNGRIVKFFKDKGYGFIEASGFNRKIFFHITSLDNSSSNSDLYKALIAEDEVDMQIDVHFLFREDQKGPVAYEITADPYYLQMRTLKKIILETSPISQNPLESFLSLVPPETYWLIDREPVLRRETISSIIKSESIWNKLEEFSEIAKDMISFFDIASPWGSPQIELFDRFVKLFCESFNCKRDGKIEYFQKYSYLENNLKEIKSPSRFFREGRPVSLLIFPNFNALDLSVTKSPELVSSNSRNLKLILVLKDEKEVLENQKRFSKSNIVIIPLRIVSYVIVGLEKRFRIMMGRALQNVFSTEALLPFVVSEDYHSNIFIGRRDLRQEILESIGTHYIIYGGRKIGKTWLIHDLCDQCEREPYNAKYLAIYTSLQSCETLEEAAYAIEKQIRETLIYKGFTSRHPYLSSLDDPLRQIEESLDRAQKLSGLVVLLAIDEVDELLKNDNRLFKKLRQLAINSRKSYKIIISGFKELYLATFKEALNDPFANWGTRIPLNCLSKEDMGTMIINPFQWIGLDLTPSDEPIIDKIFELTSGHPYYTQLLCLNIASKVLKKGAKKITVEDVEECATESFKNVIFSIFSFNLSPLQQLIGKIFATENKEFSEKDIVNAIVERFKIHIDVDRINMEMNILQACSVFRSTSSLHYVPLMQRINQEFFRERDDEVLAYQYLEKPDEH